MMNAAEPVLHLWRALAKRDWDAIKTVVSDDCIFLDVPLGRRSPRGDRTTSSNGSRAVWRTRSSLIGPTRTCFC